MRLLPTALVLAMALGAPAAASAAPGDLDPGFGSGGIFTSPLFGTQGDFDNSVARDAQGRILLVSGTDAPVQDAKSDGMAISRLTPAGALDPTFNASGPTPGEVAVGFGPDVVAGSQVLPRGVALGPGGTITVVAAISDPSNDTQLSIVRLTTDGGYDSSLDGDGRLLTHVAPGFQTNASDLLVDPDGSILVAATQTAGSRAGMLARFTPAGALDAGYGGGDGHVEMPGPATSQFFNIARTADGGVVVSGQSDLDALLAKFTSGGALDTGFGGGDGIATSDFAKGAGFAIATGFAVAVDDQSRILLGGQRTPASGGATGVVTRFSSGGDPDTGFGAGGPGPGVATVPGTLRTAGLVAGCGGAILASGQGSYDPDGPGGALPRNAPVLARLTGAGASDPAFGAGTGFTLTPVGVYSNGYRAIADGTRALLPAHRALQAPPFDIRPVVLAYQDATGCGGTPPGDTPPGGTPSGGAPPPSGGTTPVTAVPIGCTANKLILTDVFQKGAHTQILGVAPRAAVGKQIRIVSSWNGKVVARAVVKPDLSFSALAPLPPRSLRFTNRARFAATLGSTRSRVLKFARRLHATAITISGRTVTFKGFVTKPLAKPAAAVRIRASASCSTIGSGKVVATVKPTASGAFTARFALPTGQSVVYLRAQTAVRKHPGSKRTFPTFTLVRGVRIVG